MTDQDCNKVTDFKEEEAKLKVSHILLSLHLVHLHFIRNCNDKLVYFVSLVHHHSGISDLFVNNFVAQQV